MIISCGMILAIEIDDMEQVEYAKLVKRRNELKMVLSKPIHASHKQMATYELNNIRQQLKDAHHERYHKQNS